MRARRIYNERVAKTVRRTRALIEAGFEKVDEFDGVYYLSQTKIDKTAQRQAKCGESSIENYLKHLWRYPPKTQLKIGNS